MTEGSCKSEICNQLSKIERLISGRHYNFQLGFTGTPHDHIILWKIGIGNVDFQNHVINKFVNIHLVHNPLNIPPIEGFSSSNYAIIDFVSSFRGIAECRVRSYPSYTRIR